jgi:hypothetical protein
MRFVAARTIKETFAPTDWRYPFSISRTLGHRPEASPRNAIGVARRTSHAARIRSSVAEMRVPASPDDRLTQRVRRSSLSTLCHRRRGCGIPPTLGGPYESDHACDDSQICDRPIPTARSPSTPPTTSTAMASSTARLLPHGRRRCDEDSDGLGDECDPCPIARPPGLLDGDASTARARRHLYWATRSSCSTASTPRRRRAELEDQGGGAVLTPADHRAEC